MNLAKAELNRLMSRRFGKLMVVVLFAVFGLTVAVMMIESSRPSDEAWAEARQTATEVRTQQLRDHQQCLDAQLPDTEAPPELQDKFRGVDCGVFDAAQVRDEQFLSGVFVFSDEIPGLVYMLAAYLAFFGFLIAASFIGAEMSSGGLINLLLWRPQRGVVYGTKLGVLLAGLAVFDIGFTVLYVGVFWVLAATTGWAGHLGGDFWLDLTDLTLRGLLLALVVAACAYAIATIGRHTAAALGVFVGYVIGWELGARLVFELINLEPNDPFFLSTYVVAWVNDGFRYWNGFDGDLVIDGGTGAAVLLGLAVLLVTGGYFSFRRRDLT
ncbi:ABC transporter permease subunit [Catellatospora tritici]|uniref:ABC transporter permease subunit n=1 Tax=Catellatospora tritici TaxID=2851566 RepID=UPI001C2CCC54|nr:ABC transporter permease subunit [Catellatospora tritici]MBV1848793.1 ABC transporter permease subunit [Catellatospora tritici]